MMVKIQHLSFDRGDDVGLLISFFTNDYAESAILLEEFSEIRFRLLEDWVSSTVLFGAELGDGIEAFDDYAARLDIPRATTAELSSQKAYPYDVEVVTADGKVTTTQRGYVTLGPN